MADATEALGVNDRRQLAALAAIQRRRILDRLMADGVTVLDPATTYVDDTVAVGPDTILYPGVVLEGGTIIGAESVIGTGCQVRASRLADRARQKHLKPEDVAQGTFTVTNPGALGAQFGLPIINQPQVAILGVGNIEKRPIVIDDAIAIRPMAHLALGYDHRLVDGAVADHFMSILKGSLESWDPEAA